MSGADSSGQPWTGRTLPAGGFEGDEGGADARLLAALTGPTDDRELMTALAAARLLVPVVATAADTIDVDGHTVEKETDMASVTLTGPDGTRALPAFTSIAALAAWEPTARPIPVTAARAAQAAVTESCDVIVLDLADAHARELRPSMVWALAQQREWLPAHEDPFIAASVARALDGLPEVTGHSLGDGEPAGHGILAVTLALVPGLPAERVRELATGVGERLATDGELRARVDGIAFRLA
ncbi:SseB family protein [Janibacter sp. G1551]|uniref:SseB family protein n=1 Tax=Janibacter sp. G1551 TaxID=3420440 RepID=UPI003D024FAC